jgi:integrase
LGESAPQTSPEQFCASALLLAVNPTVRVPILKTHDKSARRACTLTEIKRILKACADDAEWRGLVLFGLYLGQRLGDLAKLTWRAANLENSEIAFTTRKTVRRIVLPLVEPLGDYLTSLPASDNPNALIFPRAASTTRTGTLSNQFREILVAAGLVEPRRHEATGKGRSQARETSEISFHSLRHSAVTMLKASGVSDDAAIGTVRHQDQGRVRHPAVMILLVRRYIRVPQSTEWRNIGNEIKADFVVTRTDFRKPASGQCTSMAMVSAVELGAALV